jgi:hypothetical protein
VAAPTLAQQGAIAVVTSGNLTVTLPTHATNDILILDMEVWVPNTASAASAPSAPSGWTQISLLQTPASPSAADGYIGLYWKRAASNAETNPTFTRPVDWDTGVDGQWAGRAYTISGCITTGNPWDDVQVSPLYNTTTGPFIAVTVSAAERLVVQFGAKQDDNSLGTAATGWTIGTAATTSTGTDGGFQTFRQDNVGSNTPGTEPSGDGAPVQGFYRWVGISFKPPAGTQFSQSVDGTVDFAGGLVKQTNKVLTGGVSFSGAVVKKTTKLLTGGVSFSGAIAASRVFLKSLAGTVSFVGTVAKRTTAVLTGGVSFAGGLAANIVKLKTLTGAVSFVGAVVGTFIAGVTGNAGKATQPTKAADSSDLT